MGTSSARQGPGTPLWRLAKGAATRYLSPEGGGAVAAGEVVARYVAALEESGGGLAAWRRTRKIAQDLGALAVEVGTEGWRAALAAWGLDPLASESPESAALGQLAAVQQALTGALLARYGPELVQHLNLRVQCPLAPELTLRSRSLLYLALGMMTAGAFGPEVPLIIPENGWVSLNPPLSLNRLGPYSTRTTHPHLLARIRTLWGAAGLATPLANPYQEHSKGELLAQCLDPAILQELAPLTISCARPVASRWQRGPFGHCGYCYPCLMRRAALHRLGWDRGADYRLDVLAAPETLRHRVRGLHLRALIGALKTWEKAPREILARLWWGEASGPLPEQRRRAEVVLEQGFGEIAAWLGERGPSWVRAYGGEE